MRITRLTPASVLAWCIVSLVGLGPAGASGPAFQDVPVLAYRVVNIRSHDREAFTQGLVLDDGILFESTGLRGRSSLRRVDRVAGRVERIHTLPSRLFGEGITVFGDTVIQLTWLAGIGFVYDKDDFQLKRTFRYSHEGWGITHDGTWLIVSDGSATLRFLDPTTFQELRRVEVWGPAGPVTQLNELEYVDGMVFANVWRTDLIAVINPVNGMLEAWLDLTGLLAGPVRKENVDVLNGIAYDAREKRLLVTGKLWPVLYEIELIDPIKRKEK